MKKLGFGFMRLPIKNNTTNEIDINMCHILVDTFIESGFNYFDVAYNYHGGESEKIFKECVADIYPRHQYVLANKLPVWMITNNSDCERLFNEQLEKCGVESFDYYLLHSLDAKTYITAKKIKAFEFLSAKKAEGKIEKTGFSFHDTAETLSEILSEHPEIDIVQLQINYLDWDDVNVEAKKCHEVCVKYNKKIIVMEGLRGGELITPPYEAMTLMKSHNPKASMAEWAFKFIKSLQNVEVVLSGMNDLYQLYENIKIFSTSSTITKDEENILKEVVAIFNKENKIACTNCNYCAICPKGIPIPQYMSLCNDLLKYGPNEFALSVYENLTIKKEDITNCTNCKMCENICPQHLDITATFAAFTSAYKTFRASIK